MTGNKPLGNLWQKRNMTLTWDLCSRVTAWIPNCLSLPSAHQQRTWGMVYWCQVCVTR